MIVISHPPMNMPGTGSANRLNTSDPKNQPSGRRLYQGGKKQNRESVRKELRATGKNGGPRKRF